MPPKTKYVERKHCVVCKLWNTLEEMATKFICKHCMVVSRTTEKVIKQTNNKKDT